MKPILAWIGGKRRLIKFILPHIPKFDIYHEPFVGGGALFFHLEPQKAYINDIDKRLMAFYEILSSNVEAIIERLKTLKNYTDKTSYLRIRSEPFVDSIDFASKYVYFNRLAFSSVMRWNDKTGLFNVPYRQPVKKLFDPNVLRQGARLLQRTKLYNLHFSDYFDSIFDEYNYNLRGHVFYIDTPYLSTAADYAEKFSPDDMQAVAEYCDRATFYGATVVISNNEIGASHFNHYKRLDQAFLYSVNPKHVNGVKKNEVLLMKYGFKTQMTIGEVGVTIFTDWLSQHGFLIEKNEKYNNRRDREDGVDITAYKKGKIYTFQVKYENYDNGNLAIEIWSQSEKGILGGHLTTKAKLIVHIIRGKKVFILKPDKLKTSLASDLRDLGVKPVQQKDNHHTTIIVPVPIEILRMLGCIQQEFELQEKFND